MKAKWKLFALTLAAGLTFAGCGTVEWDAGASSSPGQEAETVAETLPSREETDTAAFVEGERVLLRCEAPIPGGDAALADAFQAGDALLLFWRGANGAALEAMNPASGESLYQTALGGSVYGAQADRLTPGEYRIDSVDKSEYRSAATGEATDEKELPASAREAIRQGYPAHLGIPYDLLRGKLIVYASGEGIALASWEGKEPATVLANAAIPDWLPYWGLDAQEYEPESLFYIAPRIMGGGKYVVATAYYAGEDGARCLGIVSVEAETNRISYFPDPIAGGEAPAERLGEDILHARGEAGDILITLSTGEAELIPYDEDGSGRRSFSDKSFARIKTTEYDDGFLEFALRWEPLGQPEAGAELLKLGGYAGVEIAAVTEGYILVEAEEAGGEASLFAVKL